MASAESGLPACRAAEARCMPWAMARLSGVPDFEFVLIDYPAIPTAIWSKEEIRDLAREVAPKVRARLTA